MLNLESLRFSPLRCRYESIAFYKNEKGQIFLIQVKGLDKEAVERYIEKLRVYLEVLPYEPLKPVSEGRLGEQEKRKEQSTQDLEITIEVIQVPDIKSPYILHFAIDPLIEYGNKHSYSFHDVIEARVKITANGGTLAAELHQGNQTVDQATVDVYSGPPDQMATLSQSRGNGRSTYFSFIVTGLREHNLYELNGDVSIS